MPTWPSSAIGLGREGRAEAAEQRAQPAGVRVERHLHVLAHRQRGEGRGDLEGAADAQAPDLRAACRPTMSRPSRRTMPPSGASWPFSMLKQVLLPAPLGPISASSSPASTAKETSAHGLHAAERLVQAFDLQHRAHARASRQRCGQRLAGRRPGPAGRAARSPGSPRPCTARQNSVRRATSSRSQVKMAAPTTGPVRVSTPPSSTMTSPSVDWAIEMRRGRDAALGEGVDGAGQARQRADQHEGHPLIARARRCRSPRRAAANRGRRAGRSRRARTARATAARCRRRRSASVR